MSSNGLSEDSTSGLRMKPAVSRIFCCSVTAASGFIAAYTLVAYAIALIYEIVWVVESQAGLPAASALLMVCYVAVIVATIGLVHGLISKNSKYLMCWLIVVVLVLVPECALVFYLSISHWGLQGVYGGAELACYVARLPGVVCGVVVVQSAYAMRTRTRLPTKGAEANAAASGSEFDASHYVPEARSAFTNDGFLHDNGKAGSMPDLRRHIAARQSFSVAYPPIMPQPPPYWQHYPDRSAWGTSLRGYPKHPYGTWMGPRSGPFDPNYKRRHSIVGTFDYPDFEMYPDDRMDCKSEMGYYRYPYDPRVYDFDPRYGYDYKREDYGVNLLRHEPYHFSRERERPYYPNVRNSHTSMGNESDDFSKYKDVAL